jgi:hypothetical protein
MPANLQAILVGPDVVCVMDGPRRQPQHFLGQRRQGFQTCGFDHHGLPLGRFDPSILILRRRAKFSNLRAIFSNIGIFCHILSIFCYFIPMPDLDTIDRKNLSVL